MTNRPRRTRLTAVLGSVALAVAAVAATAPAAHAEDFSAPTRTFSTTGMKASITVTFHSKKSFTYKVNWIEDLCPADGEGVYVASVDWAHAVKHSDGSWNWARSGGWIDGSEADKNGCGNGRSTGFPARTYKDSPHATTPGISITVCRHDGPPFGIQGVCVTKFWDNPYIKGIG
ncbi:hypothetical protein [Luteimicrobium subarcticum]|uniref:Secreted protein n=1 Tax=Luteimicrobium subarcticum TaxID=620910 RepID=A0A2M8WR37_9MICO|nr:hypothetical protein [Luteimicrobium subarcticum]PJI93391.1 hypothetical protein CLV34_1960 [Luteimicrobium subarcticum]